MSLHDTAKIHGQDDSSQVYARQLTQHVKQLSESLAVQQDMLRQRGMSLSSDTQKQMLALKRVVDELATQNYRQPERAAPPQCAGGHDRPHQLDPRAG